jgi:hypothetical protein
VLDNRTSAAEEKSPTETDLIEPEVDLPGLVDEELVLLLFEASVLLDEELFLLLLSLEAPVLLDELLFLFEAPVSIFDEELMLLIEVHPAFRLVEMAAESEHFEVFTRYFKKSMVSDWAGDVSPVYFMKLTA